MHSYWLPVWQYLWQALYIQRRNRGTFTLANTNPGEKSIGFSSHVQTKKSKWIVTHAKSEQTAQWLAHQLAKVFVSFSFFFLLGEFWGCTAFHSDSKLSKTGGFGRVFVRFFFYKERIHILKSTKKTLLRLRLMFCLFGSIRSFIVSTRLAKCCKLRLHLPIGVRDYISSALIVRDVV